MINSLMIRPGPFLQSHPNTTRGPRQLSLAIDLPTRTLARRQTAAASKHSLCYFRVYGHALRRTFAKQKH